MLNELKDKAQALAHANNWGPEAKAVNQQIITLESTDVDSYTRLAKCYKEEKNFIKAHEMYKKARSLDPDNNIARNNLTSSFIRTPVGSTDEEKELFEAINLGRSLSRIHDDQGLIDIGLKLAGLIVKATVLPMEINEFCGLVVSAHLNHNDVLSATEWIDTLPSNIRGLNSLKEKLKTIEQQQGGVKIEDISDPSILNKLAKLHKVLKAYRKAELIYLKSLDLKNDRFTLNGLGGVCRDAGWHPDGIKYYNMAFELSPNEVSLVGLGGINRALNKLNLAKSNYFEALELKPMNRYAHKGLGAVLFDQGNYPEGIEHFELAGENVVEILFNKFDENIRANLIEKAIECLNLILMKNHMNSRAQKLLNEITHNSTSFSNLPMDLNS